MRTPSARLLSLGTVLALGAGVLVAQPPATTDGPRGPRAGQEPRARRSPTGVFLKDITLTDAQKTRVAALQQQFGEQRRQLVGDRQGNRPRADGQQRQRPDSATRAARFAERDAMRSKLRQLSERQFADLRAVLTPSQQTTFDRNVTEAKARMAARGQGRGGERGGERGFRRGGRAGGPAAEQHGHAHAQPSARRGA